MMEIATSLRQKTIGEALLLEFLDLPLLGLLERLQLLEAPRLELQ